MTTNRECPRCQISTAAETCPNCGLRLAAPSTEHTRWQDHLHSPHSYSAENESPRDHSESFSKAQSFATWEVFPGKLFKTYFHRLRYLLTEPTASFQTLSVGSKSSAALAFALVTNWIAASFGFVWNSIFGSAFLDKILSLSHQAGIQGGQAFLSWFWSIGSILLDPFITLITIVFTSFLVFLGARLIISPEAQTQRREVTFDSILKVICYGTTPVILSAIPVVGGLAAGIGVFVYTTIGIKEYYRTSTGRAVFVVLFPKLIFWIAITAILVLGIGMIASLVGGIFR